MVRWALAQNLSSLPPNPKRAHLDRFQRDLVDVVEKALMGSARSRKQMAEWLLGRDYVCASVLEQVSTFDVYAGISTDIVAHDSRGCVRDTHFLENWSGALGGLCNSRRNHKKKRITDVQSALVLTANEGSEREKVMALKSIIDADITDLPFVTTCLVFRSTDAETQGHLYGSCGTTKRLRR